MQPQPALAGLKLPTPDEIGLRRVVEELIRPLGGRFILDRTVAEPRGAERSIGQLEHVRIFGEIRHQGRSVEGCEASVSLQRTVQDRDVGHALEDLRVLADEVVVEQVHQLVRVVPPDRAQHHRDIWVSERGVQIVDSLLRGARSPIPRGEGIGHDLEMQPERFEVRPTTLDAMRKCAGPEP